ncbi:hypothetical protein UFOVP787_10 [uncultured Caudovirales phage]|uniref:Uncharacterized protein n=1 Tax=uncultured Caudovirales phage TaxID=2100421 RepID=A0A6J5NRN4_9CAUD|nr:hypothetical protein UFOVP787_10 [uncultured Caudovirales phage]
MATGMILDENLLHKLFMDHVRNEVKKNVQPVVDKIIDECIDQAMSSMEVNLNSYYDGLNDRKLVDVFVRKK